MRAPAGALVIALATLVGTMPAGAQSGGDAEPLTVAAAVALAEERGLSDAERAFVVDGSCIGFSVDDVVAERLVAAGATRAFLATLRTACTRVPAERPPSIAGGFTSASGFSDISLGSSHSCGLLTDGRALCWGSGERGKLGDGTTADRRRPVAVAGAVSFMAVAAGFGHSCALSVAGEAYCWGAGGQRIGAAEDRDALTPVRVAGGSRFLQVGAGLLFSCALAADGRAWCWGRSDDGALGDGGGAPAMRERESHAAPKPVAGDARFRQLSVGTHSACALTFAGEALCWGSNLFGGNGTGRLPDVLRGDPAMDVVPTPVEGGHLFRQISVGSYTTCALELDGAAWCWGQNGAGTVGDGTSYTTEGGRRSPNRPSPVAVKTALRFASVSVGQQQSCALTQEGRAYCWGAEEWSVGDRRLERISPVPQPVSTTRRFVRLAVQAGRMCGIDHSRTAYCWGDNRGGLLGDGSTAGRRSPGRPVAP